MVNPYTNDHDNLNKYIELHQHEAKSGRSKLPALPYIFQVLSFAISFGNNRTSTFLSGLRICKILFRAVPQNW